MHVVKHVSKVSTHGELENVSQVDTVTLECAEHSRHTQDNSTCKCVWASLLYSLQCRGREYDENVKTSLVTY